MDKKTAIKNLKAARAHLEKVDQDDIKAGRDWETEAYLTANSAVCDAEEAAKRAGVSWWRR